MEMPGLLRESFLLLTKFGIIVFLLVYNIFSLIVVKQVKNMTEAVEVGFETPMRILAFVHLLFSLGVFVLSFLIL